MLCTLRNDIKYCFWLARLKHLRVTCIRDKKYTIFFGKLRNINGLDDIKSSGISSN